MSLFLLIFLGYILPALIIYLIIKKYHSNFYQNNEFELLFWTFCPFVNFLAIVGVIFVLAILGLAFVLYKICVDWTPKYFKFSLRAEIKKFYGIR